MNTRQVLLAAVVIGIVGGLMAVPWFLCVKFLVPRPERSDPSANAAGAFRYDGKTFEQWQACWPKELKADRQADAFRAMTAFGTHGLGKEAAGLVVDMVREHCREIGPDCLLTERDSIYQEACTALIRIGPPSSVVLLECLKDPAKNVSHFGRVVKDVELHATAVPGLVRLVHGDNAELATLALQTLGNSLQKTPAPTEIEAALVETVKKAKHARSFMDALQRAFAGDKTRRPTLAILRTLGPMAQPAMGAVLHAVRQEFRREGQATSPAHDNVELCLMIELLGKMQTDSAQVVPVLTGIAGNKTEVSAVRSRAVKSLAEFGPQAASATETLVEALDDPIRCEALTALGKLDAAPILVVPALVQLLARELEEPTLVNVHYEVTQKEPAKVGRIYGHGKNEVPDLSMAFVDSKAPAVSKFVKVSLAYFEKIGPDAKEAVPVLVKMFRKYEGARPQVVAVLEKIGPSARQEAQWLGNELRGTAAKNQSSPSSQADIVKPVNFVPSDASWKPVNQENQNNFAPPLGAPSGEYSTTPEKSVPARPSQPQPFPAPQVVPIQEPALPQIPLPPAGALSVPQPQPTPMPRAPLPVYPDLVPPPNLPPN